MTKKIDCRMAQRGTMRYRAQIASLRHLLAALNASESYQRYVSVGSINELRSCFLFPEPLRLNAKRKRLVYHLLDATAKWNAEERESMEMVSCSMLLDWLYKHYPLSGRGDKRRREAIGRERDRIDREFLERRRYEFAESCHEVWNGFIEREQWHDLAPQLVAAAADEVNHHVRATALRMIAEQREVLPLAQLNTANVMRALRGVAYSRRSYEELLWGMVAITVSTIVERVTSADDIWHAAKAEVAQIIAARPELCCESAYRQIFDFFKC